MRARGVERWFDRPIERANNAFKNNDDNSDNSTHKKQKQNATITTNILHQNHH
jgi:hypothetical protein